MIVTCGQCGVKLKVDDAKIGERGSKLKCPKCSNIFTVYRQEAPAETPQAPPPPPPVEEKFVPPPPPPPPVEEKPAPTEPPVKKWPLDRNKVLVAHDGESILSLASELIRDAGYEVLTATEGVQAMVAIEKEMPFAVVLDVALPRIYGFEICDRLKTNPESSDIRVILIASIFEKTRYKREPVSLYGADDYVEKHHIQDYLVQKLRRLGSGQSGPTALGPREEEMWRHPVDEDPAVREAQAQQMKQEELKEFPAPSSADPQQVEAARRFARIILSDIALYNQGAVEQGIRNGTFEELLAAELKEGRELYNGRVPEDVRAGMDYFAEELQKFVDKKRRTLELG